jgi:hypothetical protein
MSDAISFPTPMACDVLAEKLYLRLKLEQPQPFPSAFLRRLILSHPAVSLTLLYLLSLQIVAVLNNHHDSLAWLDEKSRYLLPSPCRRVHGFSPCGQGDFLWCTLIMQLFLHCQFRQMHKEIALVKREMSYRNAI